MSANNSLFFKFKVTGSGVFPTELLAKYKCFPSSQESAKALGEHSYSKRVLSFEGLLRPHREEWLSYGWSVVNIGSEYGEDYTGYHTWPA